MTWSMTNPEYPATTAWGLMMQSVLGPFCPVLMAPFIGPLKKNAAASEASCGVLAPQATFRSASVPNFALMDMGASAFATAGSSGPSSSAHLLIASLETSSMATMCPDAALNGAVAPSGYRKSAPAVIILSWATLNPLRMAAFTIFPRCATPSGLTTATVFSALTSSSSAVYLSA